MHTEIPSADIEALLALFRDSAWREMHLQCEGIDLFLSKDAGAILPGAAAAPAATPTAPAAVAAVAAASSPAVSAPAADGAGTVTVPDGCILVRASSLGTFYRSPKPGAPPFCEVGQKVKADTQLCLVEVMKLFTTVRAGTAGVIRDICVKDGDMVEYEQPLFVIQCDG